MAYTSTVGLALTASAHEKLKASLTKNARLLFKHADLHKTKGGAHLFFWNCLTWDDDDPDHAFLEKFIRSLPVSEYHLCRVGDDNDDNEEGGLFADPFDLRLRREVTVG